MRRPRSHRYLRYRRSLRPCLATTSGSPATKPVPPSPPSRATTVAAACGLREAIGVSRSRFEDGLRYRIEIPSVEGPSVFRAVLEEGAARGVPVRRVSQGSGVMMLTDAEISEMATLGAEHGVEVSLFLGPRGA